MKINRRKIILSIAFIAVAIIFGSAYKWSKGHVDYVTAGQPHPLNCVPCHVYTQKDGLLGKLERNTYISPYNLTISPPDNLLLVTGQEADMLYIIDTNNNKVVSEIQVGNRPHSVAVNRMGTIAYVSNQWSDNVSVVDINKGMVMQTIETGNGPAGLILDSNENFLYAANTYSSDLSVINLTEQTEIKRLKTGNFPTGLDISPDGRHIYVVSQRTIPVPYRTPPKTETTIIDVASQRVIKRKYFNNAHLMENIRFSPEGDLAFTPLVRPHNLVPAVQVENGWMINYALGVINLNTDSAYQLPLDDPNSFYPDPYDVSVSPDGKRAFVSHSGVDVITVIDVEKIRTTLQHIHTKSIDNPSNNLALSSSYIIKRIKTGANPKGLQVSADGDKLYFAERLTDRIGIVNLHSLEQEGYITPGEKDNIGMIKKGEQLFNNASHTFQNQYSCYTCHPDNHEDGLTYDMSYYPGEDLTNVQTLRGLAHTAPFKWNGKNVSIYMQCGMRFSKYVTRSESFSPQELNALVGYIKRNIDHPPNQYKGETDELTDAQQRGKAIFERTKTNDGKIIPVENRCITCHPPPHFTNRLPADVGTSTDKDNIDMFDAPNLNNIYQSAPYLHDGRAQTLEELWTKFNDNDEHGVANDMTKNQLNDLIEYLRSLGKAEYYN